MMQYSMFSGFCGAPRKIYTRNSERDVAVLTCE